MKLLALLLLAQCVAWGQVSVDPHWVDSIADARIDEFCKNMAKFARRHQMDGLNAYRYPVPPARPDTPKTIKELVEKLKESGSGDTQVYDMLIPCCNGIDSLIVYWSEYQTICYADSHMVRCPGYYSPCSDYMWHRQPEFPGFMEYLERRKK